MRTWRCSPSSRRLRERAKHAAKQHIHRSPHSHSHHTRHSHHSPLLFPGGYNSILRRINSHFLIYVRTEYRHLTFALDVLWYAASIYLCYRLLLHAGTYARRHATSSAGAVVQTHGAHARAQRLAGRMGRSDPIPPRRPRSHRICPSLQSNELWDTLLAGVLWIFHRPESTSKQLQQAEHHTSLSLLTFLHASGAEIHSGARRPYICCARSCPRLMPQIPLLVTLGVMARTRIISAL